MKIRSFVGIVAAVIAFSSCGEEKANANSRTPPGGESAGTEGPAGTGSGTWTRLTMKRSGEVFDCLNPDRIEIEPNGKFKMSGPCEGSRRNESGTLTGSEQDSVRGPLDAIVQNHLSSPFQCETTEMQGKDRVTVDRSESGSVTVSRLNGNEWCVRGDRALHQRLEDALTQIEVEYYSGEEALSRIRAE